MFARGFWVLGARRLHQVGDVATGGLTAIVRAHRKSEGRPAISPWRLRSKPLVLRAARRRPPAPPREDVLVGRIESITGNARINEATNAFNVVNFVPLTGLGTDPNDYEVTGLNGNVTARVMQIVSRLSW